MRNWDLWGPFVFCLILSVTLSTNTAADDKSLHVKYADEAVCIGPPRGNDSYLNIPRIIAAGEITNADAIHPGYGFLAENSDFSNICKEYFSQFLNE